MFTKEQLKYLLDSTDNINYENFYKSDLITMIKILREELKIKYDGFMSSTEELCDCASELERLKDENNRLNETLRNLLKWK